MDPLFQVHRLNEDGLGKAQQIAEAFNTLLNTVETLCGKGMLTRQFSIAKEHLETACFFVKKALANEYENQQSPPADRAHSAS